jgi:hypothetical protein
MASNQNYGPVAPALPVVQGAAVTTEQYINAANPQGLASSPTSLQPSSTSVLEIDIPTNSALEQKRFQVLATGELTTGASSTVTLKLYASVGATVFPTTPPAGGLLGSSGAVTQNTAKAGFWIDALLTFDSISGTLTGNIGFFVNNTLVATVAVSNVLTGINNNPSGNPIGAANPVLRFAMTAQFSAANATNQINIPEGGFAANF